MTTEDLWAGARRGFRDHRQRLIAIARTPAWLTRVARNSAAVLNTDDEAVGCLTAFAKQHRLSASQFTGLGAFRDCVLGYSGDRRARPPRTAERRKPTPRAAGPTAPA